MFYFGGGFFGLYFWPWAVPVPPPVEIGASDMLEIPMTVITTVLQRATIQAGPAIPMQVAPHVEIAMTRGIAERVEIPMRVTVPVSLER